MFEPKKKLKTLILENLPEEGLSISALARELNGKGIKIHRLELSGYLKALADVQVLKEREVKPSKVFCPCAPKERSVYEFLGEIIQKEEESENRKTSLALYVLGRLFRRPIFERELRMCGLTGTPNCRRANEKEVMEARNIASKAGLKIPTNDRMLISEDDFSSIYSKIMSELLLGMTNLRSYASSETTQKTLEEG